MSGRQLSSAEVQAGRQLLRALATARQVYALYPAEHPKRIEAVAEARDLVLRLREATPGDPVLFASAGNFYLGSVLLAWESLTLHRLAESMTEGEIQSLEFLPNPADADIDGLVRALVGEPHGELRSVGVNRAGRAVPAEVTAGLSEMLRDYGAGLELLRETAARLLAGRPADMDATVRLTEQLADLIASDPSQALLLTTVKSYDEHTFHHMVNVCILSLGLARAIGLPREQAIALGIGGLLHDIGKVKVPQEILNHDGPLDEEQWRVVRRHPVDGAGLVLVTSQDAYHAAIATVLEHHAAFDGSGYPPLSGRRVPALPSRIVAVADCFDAMTSKRPYRKAEERRQALSILQTGAGRAFDPRVVRAFMRFIGLFPVGSLVQLTSGEVAVVVENHERLLARPKVRLVFDATGTPCDPEERDLSERAATEEFRWSVARSVDPVEVGIDMLSLLASGRLDVPPPPESGPGLVHEPSPGEVPPPGFDPGAGPDQLRGSTGH
ncbi:MAG TPA: HD-GYP domain-containing protein [Actinomycetota bacterium]|nr:HD-GYP domain-containing protein [Actinomycetota bacterium]